MGIPFDSNSFAITPLRTWILLCLVVTAGCEIAQRPASVEEDPCVDGACDPVAITSLSLVDTRTGEPVEGFDPLPRDAVLNVAEHRRVTLRANASSTTRSVRFELDDKQSSLRDTRPFAIAGYEDGEYLPWLPPMGRTILTVTAFGKDDTVEQSSAPYTVNFVVVESGEGLLSLPPVADAHGTQRLVIDDDRDGIATLALVGTQSYDLDGTIIGWDWYDTSRSAIPNYLGSGSTLSRSFDTGVHSVLLRVTDDSRAGMTNDQEFGFFVITPNPEPGSDSEGFASQYPNDVGIESDGRVVLFEDFSQESWRDQWRGADKYDLVRVPSAEFGTVLRAPCDDATNGAMDFVKRFDGQPMEMYARYYARFEEGFEMNDVGKFPGFSATFGECGWGGRTPGAGDRCWSARGDLGRSQGDDRIPVGTYLYSQDQATTWGDHDHWDQNGDSHLFVPGEWYCIETHVRVEADGLHGLLEGWIDGELAYTRRVQLADAPTYIEQFWMNLYHGGGRTWPKDEFVFFANVVVATERIGPMHRTGGGSL